MGESKRYTFKTILAAITWILLGAGTIVLLAAAINKKNSKRCNAVLINISGVLNNYFIENKDVAKILENMNMGKLEGRQISSINLSKMESVLEKNEWIKKAKLFFDNNEVLRVNIIEREPVARIFTTSGRTFYIDTSATRLPLSDKFSARLPAFTNFPTEEIMFTKNDSNLLIDIKNLSEYILHDPFWMAQIDQVNISENRTFEIIPKVGNQIIVFGNATDYKIKFEKLLTFYKQVQSKVGWNKYSKIDVQFKGQIVAVKRDAADIKMDSLKAKELMKMLVANAQRLANDSTNNIQLTQLQDDSNLPSAHLVNDVPMDESVPVSDTIKSKTKTPSTIKPSIKNIPSFDKSVTKIPAINPKLVTNKKTTTNILHPSSHEKPNPIPLKKIIDKKTGFSKDTGKSKLKPKAIMPPKNEY